MTHRVRHRAVNTLFLSGVLIASTADAGHDDPLPLGREVAVPRHLQDGEEFLISTRALLAHGQRLFEAVWTIQEGGGRPLTTGTGAPLRDFNRPLIFPFNMNRVSAPDSNACSGCHNLPRSGGGGDFVANVFVTGQRFDFATFDNSDTVPGRGALKENGEFATLQNIANNRNTLGMFGAGYIEMLARQMTEDMQAIRDTIGPGESAALRTKGVSFGTLSRDKDGTWNTLGVEGLTPMSLGSSGPDDPPSLVIRPFHQASSVVSLREFTNNAMNHHHGIQSTERFGEGTDPDGDGFVNELTRADVTAASVWQAILPVPGRVIPRDRRIERAVRRGERLFAKVGCVGCHIPSLPLKDKAWIYTEPNPFNPPGNLQVGEADTFSIDLNDSDLPAPRLKKRRGVVRVPAFTDMKLWDITCGPDDPNREPNNFHFPASDARFFAGNGRFLTKKLWGAANEPPFYHHGKYATMREAILAHCGAADDSRQAFENLKDRGKNSIIEFLKTLQVLPPGTKALVVDEHGEPRRWRSRFN